MNCVWSPVQHRTDRTMTFLAKPFILLFLTISPFMTASHVYAGDNSRYLPSGFSYLRDIAPTIMQDMRYASAQNFTNKVLPGYQASECILRDEVARALVRVQSSLKPQGYSLKVYDCYRPASAVRAFGVWARNLKDLSTKDYYPRLPKTGLFGKGYIAKRSTHSFGSTVDLTLVKLPARWQTDYDSNHPRRSCISDDRERPLDNSVEMGTRFDCFDVLSHTDHPAITGKARRNRQLLRSVMGRAGFANYRREWWHYSYKKRSYPRRYYDFNILPRHTAQ